MNDKTKQILLTNDDSIHSPGLWAAAEALDPLGYVHVVAPRDQQTCSGRSMPIHSSGIIEQMTLHVNERDWQVFSVDGSPGQAVLHGIYDVIGNKPDLVVSGINYGENIGSGITMSGTVGAALEAASLGVPALAVSMQTSAEHHFSLSQDIDFKIAGYFTQKIAQKLLGSPLSKDVDLIKLDIPHGATAETEMVLTRQSRRRYYMPKPVHRKFPSDRGPMGYEIRFHPEDLEKGSDLYILLVEKKVSVTPISIDLTSRIDFEHLQSMLDNN
ncbi:MAG: 5'/3'-nucleotidase SurE [Chloroflexota bacterium]|nr:5'/3'-nucleotidase SurE [Chloroflexota bacterium]